VPSLGYMNTAAVLQHMNKNRLLYMSKVQRPQR